MLYAAFDRNDDDDTRHYQHNNHTLAEGIGTHANAIGMQQFAAETLHHHVIVIIIIIVNIIIIIIIIIIIRVIINMIIIIIIFSDQRVGGMAA